MTHWNGVTWSLTPSPRGTSESQLVQASCPSTSSCFAVGHELPGNSAGDHTLVERWNGTTWSTMTSPNPSGADSSTLDGVSCASSTNCDAVGYFDVSSTEKTLAEHWSGTTWAIAPTPNPSGALVQQVERGVVSEHDELLRRSAARTSERRARRSWSTGTVRPGRSSQPRTRAARSTPSWTAFRAATTTSCNAVGEYFLSDSTAKTLVEHWNGTTWSIVTSPNPTGATNPVLSSVSCPTTTNCNAVGNDQINSNPAHVGRALERHDLVDRREPQSDGLDVHHPDGGVVSEHDELLRRGPLRDLLGLAHVGRALERHRLVDRPEPRPNRLRVRHPQRRGVPRRRRTAPPSDPSARALADTPSSSTTHNDSAENPSPGCYGLNTSESLIPRSAAAAVTDRVGPQTSRAVAVHLDLVLADAGRDHDVGRSRRRRAERDCVGHAAVVDAAARSTERRGQRVEDRGEP